MLQGKKGNAAKIPSEKLAPDREMRKKSEQSRTEDLSKRFSGAEREKETKTCKLKGSPKRKNWTKKKDMKRKHLQNAWAALQKSVCQQVDPNMPKRGQEMQKSYGRVEIVRTN